MPGMYHKGQMNLSTLTVLPPNPFQADSAPRIRLTVARSLSIAALSLVFLTLALGCSSESDLIAVRGRSIEIHAKRPVIVNTISYASGGEHRVLRPKASNRQLAAVLVTVVNRTSTVMPLLVDPGAARLGDRRGERIEALDPFARYGTVEVPNEDEDMFAPLLWGDVQLDRNFQVEGWVIFDVPKGLTLGTIWWDEVDEVVADFVEYRRR